MDDEDTRVHLPNAFTRHGEIVIDYLKMDIEKTEWDVLPQLISSGMLAKVRQLGVEFHLPESYETVGQYEALVNIVKSVEKAGMIRFDSKYNPWCRTKLKALDNYNGTNSFEIAFYQIFPNSNPIESVYTFDWLPPKSLIRVNIC